MKEFLKACLSLILSNLFHIPWQCCEILLRNITNDVMMALLWNHYITVFVYTTKASGKEMAGFWACMTTVRRIRYAFLTKCCSIQNKTSKIIIVLLFLNHEYTYSILRGLPVQYSQIASGALLGALMIWIKCYSRDFWIITSLALHLVKSS